MNGSKGRIKRMSCWFSIFLFFFLISPHLLIIRSSYIITSSSSSQLSFCLTITHQSREEIINCQKGKSRKSLDVTFPLVSIHHNDSRIIVLCWLFETMVSPDVHENVSIDVIKCYSTCVGWLNHQTTGHSMNRIETNINNNNNRHEDHYYVWRNSPKIIPKVA